MPGLLFNLLSDSLFYQQCCSEHHVSMVHSSRTLKRILLMLQKVLLCYGGFHYVLKLMLVGMKLFSKQTCFR